MRKVAFYTCNLTEYSEFMTLHLITWRFHMLSRKCVKENPGGDSKKAERVRVRGDKKGRS